MAEVVLVRHGRPSCNERVPIRGVDFSTWVRSYDHAPLDPALEPPTHLRERVRSYGCIVTSTLRRSVESAALLTDGQESIDRAVFHEPVFDEAHIPTAIAWRFRLPPPYWDAAMRAAWLCGWSRGVESIGEARLRAAAGALRLITLARSHGSVLLVGHGMMNVLLARELQRRGWRGRRPRRSYWSSAVLTA